MRVRYAKKNEKEIAIKKWRNNFKDSDEQIKFYFENIFRYRNYLILEKDKKIVSSLHENPYILNFNGTKINTKYIVGVATLIEEQKKGYMGVLMKEMLKRAKKNNFPLVFLTPINPEIYRKYGFEYFSKIENFKFNIDEISNFKMETEANFYEINIENKENYIDDLIFIYNNKMTENFCFLERNKYYFDKLLLECFNDNMQIYILYKNQKPEAYIIFSKYESEIEIRELFSIDYKNYENILALLYAYRDYYQEVNMSSILNSNIEYLFKNQLKVKKTETPFMMMRILNPIDVLNLSNINIKDLKIYIEDDILNENTGLYIFDKKWQFSNSSNDYIFKINIRDLVPLLCGFFSFSEMLYMNKIELKKDKKIEDKLLNEVFKRKISYLYEFQ